MNKKTKFQIECEKLSLQFGLGAVMFFEDESAIGAHEDDGNLHIVKRGMRACFDVGNGQSNTGKVQNENTRKVLTALKMEKFISDRTLVDEDDEDDEDEYDECPHCGRSGCRD